MEQQCTHVAHKPIFRRFSIDSNHTYIHTYVRQNNKAKFAFYANCAHRM